MRQRYSRVVKKCRYLQRFRKSKVRFKEAIRAERKLKVIAGRLTRELLAYFGSTDSIYQDSVIYSKCDPNWNNCKTKVFIPINGTRYGFYGGGDTLWWGGTALTYIRE